MKKEYDFSKGERGKFYHPDVALNIPIYLDEEVAEFMQALAKKKGVEVERMVNDWLKKDIDLLQSVQ